MPARLLRSDSEMSGSFLNVGKCQISFGVIHALNLIEPSERVSNVHCICHRLFACIWKCEAGLWQRVYFSCRKPAMQFVSRAE